MSAPAIEIDNLVVKFGRFTAVNRLSLTVNEGELFGFLGPNVAGKTTTIKVLIGSLRPSEGDIRVAGFKIPSEFESVKQQFGYVPDTENHIEEFTGRENLELFTRIYDMPLSTVKESLARLELSEAADVFVSVYSKGMRRKLLITREIMHRPKILYFDEPTANLDAHSTELLRDLASEGTTGSS